MRESRVVRYKSGYKYQLQEEAYFDLGILGFHAETDWVTLNVKGQLTLKKGYAWNGPSGPTFDTPDSIRGSAMHDAAYQLMTLGLLPLVYKEVIDKKFYDMCRADGMYLLRAARWFWAVRNFGKRHMAATGPGKILTAPRGYSDENT